MRSNALIWCDFFNVLCMSFLPKLTLNFFFCIFQQFLHFLNLQRAFFLVFLFQICHQNGYWMLLTYMVFILGKKDLFSFNIFWIFLLILKDIPNSSIFLPISGGGRVPKSRHYDLEYPGGRYPNITKKAEYPWGTRTYFYVKIKWKNLIKDDFLWKIELSNVFSVVN